MSSRSAIDNPNSYCYSAAPFKPKRKKRRPDACLCVLYVWTMYIPLYQEEVTTKPVHVLVSSAADWLDRLCWSTEPNTAFFSCSQTHLIVHYNLHVTMVTVARLKVVTVSADRLQNWLSTYLQSTGGQRKLFDGQSMNISLSC